MKFSDFEKMKTNTPVGEQIILDFGIWELSIVRNESSYGHQQNLWEIGVFKDGTMTEVPGITEQGDSIKGWLTEDDIDVIIKKMVTMTGCEPVQI
jgi:hypothetical protein